MANVYEAARRYFALPPDQQCQLRCPSGCRGCEVLRFARLRATRLSSHQDTLTPATTVLRWGDEASWALRQTPAGIVQACADGGWSYGHR